MEQVKDQKRQGMLFSLGAFTIWGLNPLYFRLIAEVSTPEILVHRIVWMCVLLPVLVVVMGQWKAFTGLLARPRTMGLLALSAGMISINWLVFTWAVTHDRVMETSMGYFINPLFNVLLGVVILRERLRIVQMISVVLAAAGVGYLVFMHGSLPWVAIVLPFTFGLYGLLRKLIVIDAFSGLLTEGLVLLPFAVLYWLYLISKGSSHFINDSWSMRGLLMLGGLITVVPLCMFAAGAKRIPLSLVGILQYLAPSLTFLLAVFLFHEPFDRVRLVTFVCIWLSLILFTAESLYVSRKT
jgi:chloramphenicol-sensitive protein RarD